MAGLWMMRCYALVTALALTSVTASADRQQGTRKTAEQIYDEWTSSVKSGSIFAMFEAGKPELTTKIWTDAGMKEEQEWPDFSGKSEKPKGSFGGEWSLDDSGGKVVIMVQTAPLLTPTYQTAWILFLYAKPAPLPPPILAHFLGQAEKTTVEGAGTMDLEFKGAFSDPGNRCSSWTKMTIRLIDGAMMSQSIKTLCDTAKK